MANDLEELKVWLRNPTYCVASATRWADAIDSLQAELAAAITAAKFHADKVDGLEDERDALAAELDKAHADYADLSCKNYDLTRELAAKRVDMEPPLGG